IADYLRLLYARVGRPLCYSCGREIAAQTVQQVVDRLTALPADTRLFVYAPVVRDRKGEHRKELDELRRGGFVRVRVDGALRELAEDIALARTSRRGSALAGARAARAPGHGGGAGGGGGGGGGRARPGRPAARGRAGPGRAPRAGGAPGGAGGGRGGPGQGGAGI